MHAVIETPTYLRSAKAAGMASEEMAGAIELVSRHPQIGDLIEGTGGARKVRLAGRGKGKSGGYRVITYYADEDTPVFMLDVYSKGEKANLTKAERNEFRAILSALSGEYRESVAVHARRRLQR